MINDVQSLVRFLLDDFCRADFRSLLLSFWVRKRFNPVAYRSDVSVAESYCRLRFKREFGVLWKFLEDFRNQLLNFRSAVRFFALARPNDVSVRSVESRIAFASRAFTARSKAFECAIASSSGAAKAGTAARQTIGSNAQTFMALSFLSAAVIRRSAALFRIRGEKHSNGTRSRTQRKSQLRNVYLFDRWVVNSSRIRSFTICLVSILRIYLLEQAIHH